MCALWNILVTDTKINVVSEWRLSNLSYEQKLQYFLSWTVLFYLKKNTQLWKHSMHMHNSIIPLKMCVYFVEFIYTYKQGTCYLWQNVLLQYKWLNHHEKFMSSWYSDKSTGVLLRIGVMGQDWSMKHKKNKVDTFFSEYHLVTPV